MLTLSPESLTPEAFAPFGRVIAGGIGAPSFSRPGLDHWRMEFSSDAPARLQVMRYHQQPMRFQQLERHICVTEARLPIGGAQAILVVAEATPLDDPAAQPDPDTLRAFHMDGSAGVMFHAGTWHGLNCFPLEAPHADFLFLTDAATEEEIESQQAGFTGLRTHVVDLPVAVEVDAAGLRQR